MYEKDEVKEILKQAIKEILDSRNDYGSTHLYSINENDLTNVHKGYDASIDILDSYIGGIYTHENMTIDKAMDLIDNLLRADNDISFLSTAYREALLYACICMSKLKEYQEAIKKLGS